jgi:hypothetical protein
MRRTLDTKPFGGIVEWDDAVPCACCREPVGELSFGGPTICCACDCGSHRDTHEKWTFQEYGLITRDKMTPREAREALLPIRERA